MSKSYAMGAALLLPLALLAGCSRPPAPPAGSVTGKAAHVTVIVDVSASTATMNNDPVFHAVKAKIGEGMRHSAKLGDVFSVYESGSADAARMVGQPPILTGYKLRIPAAHTKLVGQMDDIHRRYHERGGDEGTHLVQSLEAIRPDCSSGRDVIWLVSDGLEDNDDMSSVRALASGEAVRLGPPPSNFLAGCRIVFLAFGLTTSADGQQKILPPRQLAALRQGWLDYLTAAGVPAENVAFISAL